MKSRKHGTLAILGAGVAAAAMAIAFSTTYSQERNRDQTRSRMRAVYLTLTDTYAYSLDQAAYEDPANRDKIQRNLKALAENAAELEGHGGGLDPSFDYLRHSLAQDARDAYTEFKTGQYVGSRWIMRKITENCVTCHSKLTARGDFKIGAEFVENPSIQSLPPSALAEVQVATRQFGSALKTYEKMFKDPKVSWQTLSLIGAFEEYFRLCTVVKPDLGRELQTLETYRKRADLSADAKRVVGVWIASLKDLDADATTSADLEAGGKLIRGAHEASKGRSDRTGIVNFIAGVGILHRFLDDGRHEDVEVAEAYYLLAVAESYISSSYWISETDHLLEQAIRRAPKSDVAGEAYAFLVDYTTAGLSMKARRAPENVADSLDALRRLIEN